MGGIDSAVGVWSNMGVVGATASGDILQTEIPSQMEIEMKKTISKTASKTASNEITVGQSVTVNNMKTGNVPVAGVVETISKGWFLVRCPDIDGIVSARRASISPLPATSGRSWADLSPIPGTAPSRASRPLEDEDEGEDGGEDEDEDEEAAQSISSRMAEALRNARIRYAKTKRPGGAASADCADVIAKALRDLEPMEVASLADKVLATPDGFHAAKYATLNKGQVRMNSGNRVRAAYKNALEDGNSDEVSRILVLLGIESEYDEEQEDEEGDE